MRAYFAIGLIGAACAAAATAYFFFPAEAAGVLSNAAAIVAKSWSGALEEGSYAPRESITIPAALPAGDAAVASGADVPPDTVASPASTDSDPVIVASNELPPAPPASLPPAPPASSSSPPPRAVPPPSANPASSAAPTRKVQGKPCAFAIAAHLAPSYSVLLNEVAWMGSLPLGGESKARAADREWIELRNTRAAAADIEGWRIEDASGKINIVIGGEDGSAKMQPQGFYLLERGGGAGASGILPGVAADAGYSGELLNGGDPLVLFDAACGVVDRLDFARGWPGGDNASKRTLERNDDGYGWHTSADPGGTPGMENSEPLVPEAASGGTTGATDASGAGGTSGSEAATSSSGASGVAATGTTGIAGAADAAPARVFIAEVQVAGASADNDFVKIYNPGAVAADLGGYRLRKRSKSGAEYSLRVVPEGSSILPGGWFVWANGKDGFAASLDADATSSATLSADNSVALLDPGGAVIDAVAWGNGIDQYVEGAPYPTNPGPNEVLKRKFAGGAMTDSGDNASDFAL